MVGGVRVQKTPGVLLAHWWVELGLGPLMGRVMSRGMSTGGCRLRESLGSWSADGWGFVPTQIVVRLEASQHSLLGGDRSWC